MLANRRNDVLLAAGCGAVAGAALGWQGGWIAVECALVVLFSRLLAAERDGRRAAWLSAAFVGCFYAAGHAGAVAAVAAPLRPWAFAVWLLIAGGQAAVAALSVYVAFRLPLPPVWRSLLLIPSLWVAREWSTTHTEIAMPWLAIGYAHAPDGPFAGLLPLGGVLLASGASLAAAAALAIAWRDERPRARRFAVTCTSLCIAASFASGQVGWTRASHRSAVQLVQSGPPAAGDHGEAVTLQALKWYADIVDASSAALVVTPQLALAKTPGALPPGYLDGLDTRLRARAADALIGMHFESGRPAAYFNGVAALGISGVQRYRKHHLMPFGEYLPVSEHTRRWVDAALHPPLPDAARGPLAEEPLHGGGLRLAIAVCYEAGFGHSLRRQAATADAIVNLSSDSAHDSLQLARQIRQVAQARTLELQKPLMRTSDVRGTYFIDATGRVDAELPSLRAGTITRTVVGRSGLTPYARWGDGLALAIAGLAVSACLLRLAGRRARLRPFNHPAAGPVAVGFSAAGRARQRGQVLPVALVMLVLIAGVFYLMVNAGQTVTEKMRVTNAADAAAYSTAVVEARALNYNAYLNRAMVANQMAIAQTVSFASWLDYFATAADTFGDYGADMNYFLLPNPDVAVLDVAFAGSAAVAAYFGGQTVHAYLDYVIDYAAGAIILAHDAATRALAESQRVVQLNLTAGVRQRQIARQVVRAMDPALDAEVVLASHGFDAFTKNYAGDERDRFADVAMRSRDLFTRERNFTLESFDIPFIRKDGALKKRGGTDLIGFDEWRGVDTLELHGQRFGCGKLGVSWCKDIRQPIGWGGIKADMGGDDAGRGHHGNAYNENPTTADEADGVMRSTYLGYFTGIPTSQEIADVDPAHDASTGITIRVSKSQSDTLTSGNAAQVAPSGSLAVFGDHPAGGQLAALSRAQVFFDRISARDDGKSELGSLYNPYWRVRLVAPTAADRAYAATRQGGLAMPAP